MTNSSILDSGITQQKGIHLKGLNGIRAIAALSVVISHALLSLQYFGAKKVEGGWDFATYGVTMFFTLSGFLITYLLIKEKDAFSTINIKEFYVRRVLRIWPLYYFYILLALVFIFFNFRESLSGGVLFYYLFMGGNICFAMGLTIPLLGHFWSLGVEEQFYLFWPWLVKRFHPLKSISFFLLFFFLLKAIMRITVPELFWYKLISITKFDCMAIGALCAILFDRNNRLFISLSFNKFTQIASWSIILLAAFDKLKIPDFINQDVFSAASAIIILNVAFNKNSLISLENRVFSFLGKISYGMYVYNSLVIYCLGLLLNNKLSFLNNFCIATLVIVLAIAVTILISWLSYQYLEKYFLRFKPRFSKVLSHP